MSSAEAGLVALSKLAAGIIGVRSMALEWEVVKEGCACQLYADASAALSIAKRQGAEKMRHLNVRTLWLQEKAVEKDLEYQTNRGVDTPARATRTRLDLDRADISLKLAD